MRREGFEKVVFTIGDGAQVYFEQETQRVRVWHTKRIDNTIGLDDVPEVIAALTVISAERGKPGE